MASPDDKSIENSTEIVENEVVSEASALSPTGEVDVSFKDNFIFNKRNLTLILLLLFMVFPDQCTNR